MMHGQKNIKLCCKCVYVDCEQWKLNIFKDAVDLLLWRRFFKLTTINGIQLSVNA